MTIKSDIVYYYKAKVNRVVDGDTLDLSIDLGFDLALNVRARLQGINAPEISRPKNKDELQRGLATKARVQKWIDENSKDGYVIVKSHNGKQLKQEKYGRWLVEVYSFNYQEGQKPLNDILLEENMATSFMRNY